MTNSLLPPSRTQLEIAAEAVMARIGEVDTPIRSLWDAASCPAALLPWLAWAYAVDQWDDDWTDQQRRATVATAILVHQKKGTPSAMKSAISALGYNLTLTEWWQTNGHPPGTFGIDIDLAGGQTTAGTEGILDVIERVKNVRSHLWGLTYRQRIQGNQIIAAAQSMGLGVAILPKPANCIYPLTETAGTAFTRGDECGHQLSATLDGATTFSALPANYQAGLQVPPGDVVTFEITADAETGLVPTNGGTGVAAVFVEIGQTGDIKNGLALVNGAIVNQSGGNAYYYFVDATGEPTASSEAQAIKASITLSRPAKKWYATVLQSSGIYRVLGTGEWDGISNPTIWAPTAIPASFSWSGQAIPNIGTVACQFKPTQITSDAPIPSKDFAGHTMGNYLLFRSVEASDLMDDALGQVGNDKAVLQPMTVSNNRNYVDFSSTASLHASDVSMMTPAGLPFINEKSKAANIEPSVETLTPYFKAGDSGKLGLELHAAADSNGVGASLTLTFMSPDNTTAAGGDAPLSLELFSVSLLSDSIPYPGQHGGVQYADRKIGSDGPQEKRLSFVQVNEQNASYTIRKGVIWDAGEGSITFVTSTGYTHKITELDVYQIQPNQQDLGMTAIKDLVGPDWLLGVNVSIGKVGEPLSARNGTLITDSAAFELTSLKTAQALGINAWPFVNN